MFYSLVIVDNHYCFRSIIGPNKADSILVIDPDAVLARPFTTQTLEPVPGWYTQLFQ